MNVKELKDKLTELVNSLNDFDENTEAIIEIDDNCGGSYISKVTDFSIEMGKDGKVYMSNF